MPAQTTVPPFTTWRSATGRRLPTGAKMIAASSGSRGVRLRRHIARPREGKYFAPLETRNLGDDVRGRAEAVDSEAAGVTCRAERAIPDEPGAQPGRELPGRSVDRQAEAKALVRHHI